MNEEQEKTEAPAKTKKQSIVKKLWILFAIFVVAIAGVFGSMLWQSPQLYQSYLPAFPVVPAENETQNVLKIDKLFKLVSELENRIEKIEKSANSSLEITELSLRIDKMANKINNLPNNVQPSENQQLTKELDSIEQKVVTLQNNKAEKSILKSFSKRLETVEEIAHDIAPERLKAVALLLAAGQLREAIASSKPFAKELETIKAVIGSDNKAVESIASLKNIADMGVLPFSIIKEKFKVVAGKAVWADAKPKDENWHNKLIGKMMTLVTIRRTDETEDKNSTASKVSRAEKHLENRDIKEAVKELETLTSEARDIVLPWLKEAKNTLKADEVLSELMGMALIKLSNHDKE